MILPTFRDTEAGLVVTCPHDSISDRLDERSTQLHSLITTMLADDHVFGMAQEIQHDLLWLAGSISEEIKQLLDAQLQKRAERTQERMQRATEAGATPSAIWSEIEAMSDHELNIAAQAALARARESEHAGAGHGTS